MLQSMHWFAVRREWGPVGESTEPLTMHKDGVGGLLVWRHGFLHSWAPHVGGCRASASAAGVCGALGPPWLPSRLGFPRRCKGAPSTAGAATLSLHVVLQSVGRLAVTSCVSGRSWWLPHVGVWQQETLGVCQGPVLLQPSYMHPASHSS